jgi:hypothetical protein
LSLALNLVALVVSIVWQILTQLEFDRKGLSMPSLELRLPIMCYTVRESLFGSECKEMSLYPPDETCQGSHNKRQNLG